MSDNANMRDPVNELEAILTSRLTNSEKLNKIEGSPMHELWLTYCPAEKLRKVEALLSKIELYPESNRILPTRLGNVMRSSEDQVRELGDGNIQSFIMRNRKSIPDNLMVQHDMFRNRLDMYCSLMLVFLFLAIFSPMQLSSNETSFLSHSLVAFSLYGILAMVSYGAAIASAKGYGLVLVEINYDLKRGKVSSNLEDDHGYL